MSDISFLLKKREETYQQITKEIIALFKETLDKAMQYAMKDDRTIDWFSFEVLDDLKNFVYIQGYFTSKISDELIVDGTKVTITQTNQNKNSRFVVRLLLPIKLLESGNAEEIYKAINDLMQSNKLAEPDNTKDDIRDDNSKLERPKEFMGFDIENLPDDKIQQLMFSALLMNVSKN